jgi:prephenate dehydrogenase
MSKKQRIGIGIIGFGNFGLLTASVLSKHTNLQVHDNNKDADKLFKAKKIGVELVNLETLVQNDVIILAVPISETKQVIKKIASLLRPGTLVLDTCSVKVNPCRWLKKYLPEHVEILGTHPMFGPTTTKFDFAKQKWILKSHQIVLCPLRIKKAKLSAIKNFLIKFGIQVIITTPQDHDQQNAKTLSLVHFLGRSLLKAGIGEQQIFTPGYTDLLSILPHTTGDKLQLFYDMNNYNPYSRVVRNNFLSACDIMETSIEHAESRDDISFMRKQIDKFDSKIMVLLSKRFEAVEKIGMIKKKQDIDIVNHQRESEIVKKQCKKSKLKKDFIEKFYKLVFEESYKYQK